jgi:hypothetical protein
LFQFGKGGQAREQLSLDEEGRFRMASRCHAERVSICSEKKSLRHPFRVEIIWGTFSHGRCLRTARLGSRPPTHQRRANFRYAFSAFEFVFACMAWFAV